MSVVCCLFIDTATTEIYTYCHTLSLHDALPILGDRRVEVEVDEAEHHVGAVVPLPRRRLARGVPEAAPVCPVVAVAEGVERVILAHLARAGEIGRAHV